MGGSFDTGLMEESAAMAAREAAATGVQLTFLANVRPGARPPLGPCDGVPGEDPLLIARMTEATVRGYQGDDLTAPDKIAACFKHFGGYGRLGGRPGLQHRRHLTTGCSGSSNLDGYKAAVDAGAAMGMTSFNTIDRIPATGSKKLYRKILRDEWGFEGVAITDFDAVNEMIPPRLAGRWEGSRKVRAQSGRRHRDDVHPHLKLRQKSWSVRAKWTKSWSTRRSWRILKLKNKLGLFENPFKGADPEKEKELFQCDAHMALARKAAAAVSSS